MKSKALRLIGYLGALLAGVILGAVLPRPGASLIGSGSEAEVRQMSARLNELAFWGQTKPFDTDRIQVRIEAVSDIPDERTAPYADCLATARAELVGGEAYGLVEGDRFVLRFGAFRNRQRLDPAIQQGGLYEVTVALREEMGVGLAGVYAVDHLDDFELPILYATSRSFGVQDWESVDLAERRKGLPRFTREAWIASERERIESWLSQSGEDWLGQFAAGRDRFHRMKIARDATEDALLRRGKAVFCSSAYTLPPPDGDEWLRGPVAAIGRLNQVLTEKGIDLIVAPFADREILTAHGFLEDLEAGEVYDPFRERVILELLRSGIEVVDARPAMAQSVEDYEWFYYDGRDEHPADGAVRVMARQISERLGRYDFPSEFDSLNVATLRYRIPREMGRFPEAAKREARYSAQIVMNGLEPLPESGREDSPVLVIGDSFAKVPIYYGENGVHGANLLCHIAKNTGVHPDFLRVKPRAVLKALARDPDVLDGRKVVVFTFAGWLLRSHDLEDGQTGRWELTDLEL